MDYFEKEKEKEFAAIGFKNKRRNLRELNQTGRTTIPVDLVKRALLPGKRMSASGKIYWETRKNRSDKKGSRI